jgi:hypothetical protein
VRGKTFIQVADLVMGAQAACDSMVFELPASHAPFQVAAHQADLSLSFLHGSPPAAPELQLVFDSLGLWRLYRHGELYHFTVSNAELGPSPHRVAVLDPSFAQGTVYCRTPALPDREDSRNRVVRLNPFEYPLDEVILVHYLLRGRGLHVHACGIAIDGRGFLFAGPSGAGKSTLTALWQPTGASLLSDDRIIIRRRHHTLQMYGTPWHGDLNICSPESAPLEKIFFLARGSENSLRPLPPVEVATLLLSCSFPPFYDREAMIFVLDFISQIIAEIPCFELKFVPDARVIDFIRESV